MKRPYRTKEEMYKDWQKRFRNREEYHDIHGFYIGPGSQVEDMPTWVYIAAAAICGTIVLFLLIVNLI